MRLVTIDWVLVAAYFAFSFAIAIFYYRRAGKNTSEFFLTGRNMPWWLAGTSMVATTFAADTPLAVTELVAESGISGNWLWWAGGFGAILTVFFFARLWRRAGILTDVEFVELRYSGQAAAWLRGIKAIYFGLLMNCIIMGWVALAMETIIRVLFPDLTIFGQTHFELGPITVSAALMVVGALIVLVSVYALLSGLWGVAVTDFFQFAIAMTATILLAVFALRVPEIGGLSGLMEQLPEETFRFLPTIGEAANGAAMFVLTVPAFVAYIGIQWWSSWYPGTEPGGGGYNAQRMMSAKDEKHSLFAALWFVVAHICLRPWPWIIVALCALILYPNLTDAREGYVLIMRDVLPAGVLGLLFAAFLAAFMSTISTQLNWGVSYLVNDFWRRFMKPDETERHYVLVSRILTFVLGIVAFFVTTQLTTITQAWGLILSASAGLGMVLILRWYWWRVNAWSELAATLVPIIIVVLSFFVEPLRNFLGDFPINLYGVVTITTVVWLTVTFLTSPTDQRKLDAFYRRVHPGGPGWKPVAERHPDVEQDGPLWPLFLNWLAGCLLVFLILFGVGNLLFGMPISGVLCLLGAGLAGAFLYWDLNRRGFETVMEQESEPIHEDASRVGR